MPGACKDAWLPAKNVKPSLEPLQSLLLFLCNWQRCAICGNAWLQMVMVRSLQGCLTAVRMQPTNTPGCKGRYKLPHQRHCHCHHPCCQPLDQDRGHDDDLFSPEECGTATSWPRLLAPPVFPGGPLYGPVLEPLPGSPLDLPQPPSLSDP